MGNQQSIFEKIGNANLIDVGIDDDAPHDAPLALRECCAEDGLDPSLFFKYQEEQSRKEAFLSDAESDMSSAFLAAMLLEEESLLNTSLPKEKKKRGRRGVVFYTDEFGVATLLPPNLSFWYNQYCTETVRCRTDHPRKWLDKFRRRFRCPYKNYLELVDDAINHPIYFRRWKPGTTDATGKPCMPIHLLVLTSLRYLGRGWTFDDLEEATAMSEDVIRVFFHEFVLFGQMFLFPKYVRQPRTVEDADSCEAEFAMAGLPGCIGSMDASHVSLERCEFRLRQPHLAAKMPFTSRSYNIVTNHRRRILSTTEGHPATWNDKTLVTFDEFVMGLKSGKYFGDRVFELYDCDANGSIIKQKYHGAWLCVDNGYHSWSITVPPFKRTQLRSECRFSAWLESMRKDVECTFGILKGRWRILKAGIRVHGTAVADQIWMTCCALHNMLLEEDGLDERWSSGVRSDWEGDLGLHDQADVNRINVAIHRLNHPDASRQYDSSARGVGNDFTNQQSALNETYEPVVASNVRQQVVAVDGSIILRTLTLNQFRSKLVTHFDIAYRLNKVVWPSRTGVGEPNFV